MTDFWTARPTLVTGGAGFLGRAVCKQLAHYEPADVFVPRSADHDLRDQDQVRRLFRVARPEVIIHLAAVVGGIGANRMNPGRYFWRVAPLTSRLGPYSVGRPVEIGSYRPVPLPTPAAYVRPPNEKRIPNPILMDDGWRAAVGDTVKPVAAHLRSPSAYDLVTVNSDGVTFALDGRTGIALWTGRAPAQRSGSSRPAGTSIVPMLVTNRLGTDNVVTVFGTTVTARDGNSGRELWTSALPSPAAGGLGTSDSRTTTLFLLDTSLQRLFVLNGLDGSLMAQVSLRQRAIGGPAPINYQGLRGVIIALEDGGVDVFDKAGRVVRSGQSGSTPSTPPLFVNGPRSGLILIGSRNGLTALDADDMRALGRVTLKDDVPRGSLAAEDLDGDGVAEVVMITVRDRVVAVNAADGKILWQAEAGRDAGNVAFADVNRDGVLDVLLAAGQTFATALSGRDGSVIWKEVEAQASASNHASSVLARSISVVPDGLGVLLVAGDAARSGLRAVRFSRAAAPR